MQQTVEDLRKAYKVTVIIGLGMMASLLLYAIIVEVIRKQHAPFGGFAPLSSDADTLRYALFAAAVAVYFLARMVKRTLLSSGADGPAGFAQSVQKLMTAAVIGFALAEAVAVFGLVLFLLQGQTTDFYLFLMVSLFYFNALFPKYRDWEQWMRERERRK